MTDLFIGLVTYRGTRFPDSSGPHGVLAVVEQRAREHGLNVMSVVSEEDAFDEKTLPVSVADVRASIAAELDLEGRWRCYLSGSALPLSSNLALAGRRLWRTARLAPWWSRRGPARGAGERMVRRLANIEAAHMGVMRSAVSSGAKWILTLEDDAGSHDPVSFADQLLEFFRLVGNESVPGMVSLSQSFTPEALGVSHLLAPVSLTDSPWRLHSALRPISNTVCATLYQSEFLGDLVERMNRIPLKPVVPIDFKLNEALMGLAPFLSPRVVWLADPAPLQQRSGVPTVRM